MSLCSVGVRSSSSGMEPRFKGLGVVTSVQEPNFASVRARTVAASSGSSTFQR